MKLNDYYKEYIPICTKLEDMHSHYTIECILKFIPENGVAILDVGCGNGSFSRLFKKSGNYVAGIEINQNLAEEAARVIDDVLIQDAELPWALPPNNFDIVVMSAFLEHIFDYHFVLNETNRVLRSGGNLIILVPNIARLDNRVALLLGMQPGWYREFQHIRPWTKPFLGKQLELHGFKPVKWLGSDRHILKFLGKIFPGLSRLLICKATKVENKTYVDPRICHIQCQNNIERKSALQK